MSQKKTEGIIAETMPCEGEGIVRVRSIPYRVDSELGRFTFDTHEVAVDKKTIFKSTEILPAQRGKQYYLTQGFRDIAMLTGATQCSYRKTTERLNRLRRQEQEGTPITTLRDATEVEGTHVLDFWEAKTEAILAQWSEDHEVFEPGLCDNVSTDTKQSLFSTAEVKQAMYSADVPEELRQDALASPVPYERPECSVNICADGVVTKAQREKRRRLENAKVSTKRHSNDDCKEENPQPDALPSGDSNDKKTKRLNHKTATIEHDEKRYTLVSATYVMLFRTILAFLINNGLHRFRLCFFTDGEISLKNALIEAFSWHPAIVIILDWHHIEKKCAEFLSMSVKGKELRNEHRGRVSHFLWHGATQSAIDYLKQIPKCQIKNTHYIDRLCAYLYKRQAMIPCYAIRKSLGLRNSSNPVEKANDQLVSSRQKHQGMSWSQNGSLALAALSAVIRNRHRAPWLRGHVLPFTLVPSDDEAAQKVMDKAS